MRRIIERKVTVVTTTTWTISWQDDSLPLGSQSEVDPTPKIITNAEASSTALTAPDPSALIEIKEADPEGAEKSTESNPPAHEIQPYPSKPERK